MPRAKRGVPIPQFNLTPEEIRGLRPPDADRAPPAPPPRAAPREAERALPTHERPNQRDLTPVKWRRYINAILAIAQPDAETPSYRDFVDVHDRAMRTMTGMMWGAHSMPDMGHDGRNFLAWHRDFLWALEVRLRHIDPTIFIPYWNWVEDRALPAGISDVVDLRAFGVTRNAVVNGALLPDRGWINAVMNTGVATRDFRAFQTALEQAHNAVHSVIGGTMGTSSSPADPIFWLHHAFIDKLWRDWQLAHPDAAFGPPNATELMKPLPIFTLMVRQVLDSDLLGYHYG